MAPSKSQPILDRQRLEYLEKQLNRIDATTKRLDRKAGLGRCATFFAHFLEVFTWDLIKACLFLVIFFTIIAPEMMFLIIAALVGIFLRYVVLICVTIVAGIMDFIFGFIIVPLHWLGVPYPDWPWLITLNEIPIVCPRYTNPITIAGYFIQSQVAPTICPFLQYISPSPFLFALLSPILNLMVASTAYTSVTCLPSDADKFCAYIGFPYLFATLVAVIFGGVFAYIFRHQIVEVVKLAWFLFDDVLLHYIGRLLAHLHHPHVMHMHSRAMQIERAHWIVQRSHALKRADQRMTKLSIDSS